MSGALNGFHDCEHYGWLMPTPLCKMFTQLPVEMFMAFLPLPVLIQDDETRENLMNITKASVS